MAKIVDWYLFLRVNEYQLPKKMSIDGKEEDSRREGNDLGKCRWEMTLAII